MLWASNGYLLTRTKQVWQYKINEIKQTEKILAQIEVWIHACCSFLQNIDQPRGTDFHVFLD